MQWELFLATFGDFLATFLADIFSKQRKKADASKKVRINALGV
jgi:hypothetical protein